LSTVSGGETIRETKGIRIGTLKALEFSEMLFAIAWGREFSSKLGYASKWIKRVKCNGVRDELPFDR